MTVNVSDQFKPYKCVLKHKLYHNLSTSVRIKTLLVFFFLENKTLTDHVHYSQKKEEARIDYSPHD